MRENMDLYRGKRIDGDGWVYGSLIAPIYGARPLILQNAAIDDSGCLEFDYYFVDPDTVGKCTGLRDKNGKLIFEGDIVRLYEEESGHEADGYGVVHFGRFKDTDAISDFDHLGFYITVTTIPNEATTVLALEEQGIAFELCGNVVDNPELLRGGEGE